MEIYTGKMARKIIGEGNWEGPTPGLAQGYTQANLVVLPYKYAFDFLLFCQRNPRPCPILEVCERGKYTTTKVASNGDIRRDIPKYRIYEDGNLAREVTSIEDIWQDDFVSFLLGCSFTFESALLKEDIPIRHIEEERNVPMYITNIECAPAGIFSGTMVVSMRPIPRRLVEKAVEITSQFPKVHGAPIHIGNPEGIGIKDITLPDFGDMVTIKDDEVPVFWACGVTPQVAIMRAKPDLVITHAPGHMFITDVRDEELKKDV
ncbi:putative hydro-lyase [Alkaliphilus serpentinus]|uniref:Putative hydro-lyase F8153_04805 n=1 Tax=Alkaliphilus serpentinus TaxID=1482731 RepID=A0A833HQ46_9FIRM|nr:putative hydro-lyase [Alkaliphilus serpentinus]KAB3531499.1 putative hydro-lyase [Alkaliphilus serpentinus]